MTNSELVTRSLFKMGQIIAKNFQENADSMTSTEIVDNVFFVPDFNPTKQYSNFKTGYICKSPSGNVVRLITPYDSVVNPESPENLPSNWKIYRTANPEKAKSFSVLSTSPYDKGDVCTYQDQLWRSLADHNLYSPTERPDLWEKL